ncbi:MAG: hypothetical protein QNJ30_03690 [Kiloniellales bacterium]|nr:hypothetical protein [Kiloniellales bacterium]
MTERLTERQVAERLAGFYDRRFGGKDRGRFRISMKHFKLLTQRRRVPAETVRKIGEELFELGFVLIDLETFFVILPQRSFRNYRRLSDSCVAEALPGGSATDSLAEIT